MWIMPRGMCGGPERAQWKFTELAGSVQGVQLNAQFSTEERGAIILLSRKRVPVVRNRTRSRTIEELPVARCEGCRLQGVSFSYQHFQHRTDNERLKPSPTPFFARTGTLRTCFHLNRASGGNRNHRDPGRPFVAGFGKVQNQSARDYVPEQPQTVDAGMADVCKRLRRQHSQNGRDGRFCSESQR